VIIRIVHKAENRYSRVSPVICVIINRNEIIIPRRSRCPGLYLQRGAEEADDAIFTEVEVGVLAEITLLRNLVKSTSVALKE